MATKKPLALYSGEIKELQSGDILADNGKLDKLVASTGVSGTITVSTSDPSEGADGDIWLKYVP